MYQFKITLLDKNRDVLGVAKVEAKSRIKAMLKTLRFIHSDELSKMLYDSIDDYTAEISDGKTVWPPWFMSSLTRLKSHADVVNPFEILVYRPPVVKGDTHYTVGEQIS
jgi:hypothetical protein